MANDYQNKLKFMIAWNIEKDMEVSCTQRKTYGMRLDKTKVLKGMNENINYYQCNFYIIDLNNNLPMIVTSNRENDEQLEITNINIYNIFKKIPEQKKIYKNNTKYLGI